MPLIQQYQFLLKNITFEYPDFSSLLRHWPKSLGIETGTCIEYTQGLATLLRQISVWDWHLASELPSISLAEGPTKEAGINEAGPCKKSPPTVSKDLYAYTMDLPSQSVNPVAPGDASSTLPPTESSLSA